jgi:hypothetical protein
MTEAILQSAGKARIRWLIDKGIGFAVLVLLLGFPGIIFAKEKRERAAVKLATQTEQAKREVAILQPIAEAYFSTHRKDDCPTIPMLSEVQALGATAPTVDPWGQPYSLACNGDDLTASSAGPNRIAGDEDDVRYPTVP